MFAGDKRHNRYLNIVQDAIESGWREANRLLQDFRNSHQSSLGAKPKECSVVIVGGGMAGLGAARELLAAGISDIVILEAQNQAGGRVCSVPLGNGWLELGAQWIHGEDNPMYRLAHKHGLLSDTTSAEGLGPYLQSSGSELCSSLVAQVTHKISQILEDCEKFVGEGEEHPPSLGHYMLERFEKYMATCTDDTEEISRAKWELFHWHRRFQEIDNSCSDLYKLSAKDWGKYKFTGGEDCNNLLNGYVSLINILLQDLPENILYLNTPVKTIKWESLIRKHGLDVQPNGSSSTNHQDKDADCTFPVTVFCADGSFIRTSHVIVTCSIGYLKENLETLFQPSLPSSMCSVIKSLGFGLVDKVFLLYDEPWWDEKRLAFQVVQPVVDASGKHKTREDPSWWLDDLTGFDVLSRDPPVLLAWVGGAGAAHMEKLPESEVAKHCTDILQKYTRCIDVPSPSSVIRSSWSSNPYIRGGYSHTTTTCDKLRCGPKDLAQPVYTCVADHPQHPAILLAGEAAHEFHFSTTHGAFESGQSQARVIAEYCKERNAKCTKLESATK